MDIQQTSSRDGVFLLSQLSLRIALAREHSGSVRPYRVVQLSDFHSGVTTKEHLLSAADVVQRQNPDLVVITGDFVQVNRFGGYADNIWGRANLDTARRRLPELRTAVANVSAILEKIRPEDGIIGTFGNHDHKNGIRRIRNAFSRHIRWLENESLIVEMGGVAIQVGGVADFQRGKPDIETTWANRRGFLRRGALAELTIPMVPDFRLLLSHNPDALVRTGSSVVDSNGNDPDTLALCGHTHGGQVCLPGGLPVLHQTKHRKYIKGFTREEHRAVYTSQGTGYGGIAIRAFCPPEIVVVDLHFTKE